MLSPTTDAKYPVSLAIVKIVFRIHKIVVRHLAVMTAAIEFIPCPEIYGDTARLKSNILC